MPNPQKSIDPKYSLKSSDLIGEHVTQIAVDGQGEYAVLSNSTPAQVAAHLHRIAEDIELSEMRRTA